MKEMKMKKQIKYFKSDLGASLMEVIFVLGIMAVMTPVVMKYAFKDLADIKYLNLAKQFKQLIKTLTAYTSSERDNWVGDSGMITNSDLDKYGLLDSVDKTILDNLSVKYVKGDNDSFALYGVVNMTPFHLDAVALNKTLLYVEDHIGYVVNGEKCGSCTTNSCVCAINGNWGVNYSEVSKNGEPAPDNPLIAVVRIDDVLLEEEFDSTIYLYRNRNDSNLNRMGRDFYLGPDSLNTHDVKNVKEVNAQTVSGLAGVSNGVATEEKLTLLKSKKGSVAGDIQVKGSIYFKNVSSPTLSFASAKIYVPKIIFEKVVDLNNFIFPNAYLLMGDLGSLRPKIVVDNLTSFENIDLQNLVVKHLLSDDSRTLDVYGFDDDSVNGLGMLNNTADMQKSRLHVKVPNVNVKTMNAKIINVNNHYMGSVDGKISFKNGVIQFSANSAPVVNLYDIKGNTNLFSVWGLINKFEEGTTGDGAGSLKKRIAAIPVVE